MYKHSGQAGMLEWPNQLGNGIAKHFQSQLRGWRIEYLNNQSSGKAASQSDEEACHQFLMSAIEVQNY